MSPDYAVTLIEARDVVARAMTLAERQEGWFLLILSSDDEIEAWSALADAEPGASMVIEEGDDPVIALAHLIAAASWEKAELAEAQLPSALEAREQYG